MNRLRGLGLGYAALWLYVIGGISAFAGIAMIALMDGKNLLGWGEAQGIGYLFLCCGVGMSLLGVLLMRIFRNRQLI